MKKLFTLMAVIAISMSFMTEIKAQPLQDFEAVTFPPTGWTVEFTGTQYWTRNAFTSYLPPQTGAAKFNFFSASGGTIQSLVTPTLQVSVAGDSVKFDLSYHTYTGHEVDTLYIMASSDNGTTYTLVKTLLGGDTIGTGMVTWAPSSSSSAPTLATQWAKFKYALPVGTNKIKFKAASGFGNNLYVDNIQTKPLTTALGNDVATTAIVSPSGTLTLPVATIAPSATFGNVGTNNQVSIPVTFKITGPVNYTNSKVIAALASGGSTTVKFDSTFVPTAGTYNVTVYTGLATDGNRSNDTLKSTFTVVNPNYATGTGGISFANSISTGAPSKPEVCFPDTAGGITLCRKGVNNYAAVFTGTLDDGYWSLGGLLPTGYKIRVNGVDYDSIFVSTNGIIGLTKNAGLTDFSPGLLPDPGQTVALFPLWKDFDFRGVDSNSYIKVAVKGTRLYIYSLSRVYNLGSLTDVPDAVFMSTGIKLVNTAVNSNIVFQYGDMSKGTTASFIAAVNANTLADHVIGMQSGATHYAAYRQRITTLITLGPIFSSPSGGSLAVEFGPDATKLNSKCATLNLNLCLEVCAGSNIKASLFSASTCSILDSKTVFLPMTGPVNIDFAGVDNTTENYYIKVEQQNSLTIWSNSITFTGFAKAYNFKTGLSQVYGGSNLINTGGVFCMISGDVNRDGGIDGADLSDVENDAISGTPGSVSGWQTDLTCDGFVDASDIGTIDNNSGVGYFEASPSCPIANGDYSNVDKVHVTSYDRQVILPEVDKTTPLNVEEKSKFDFYNSNKK